MNQSGPAPRWRVLFVFLAGSAAILAAAALWSPTSEAAPGRNCTYYSDASRTTVVGQYGYDCCNNSVAWGSKTAYSACGGCFVCTPPPP
jgi:hypothetical protein